MAVLTIQYPQEPKPAKRYAVGIDLGTTHSLIACDIDGQIQVLTDENNQALLPSVVRYLADGTTVVGIEAKAQWVHDPINTISSIKRLMGRSPKEVLANSPRHFQFADSESAISDLLIDTGKVNPMEVSAQILKKLMERAHQIDTQITEAVITVPAYFDEAQRQATKDAARLAGIQVLRLINEPTAAAMAYGLDKNAQGFCLIYDFGGGTFDVSLLELSKGIFEVRATGGDTSLGGDDIDDLIVQWIETTSGYARQELNLTELLSKARLAKEALSTQLNTLICLENGWQGDLSVDILNKLITPLIHKTLQRCQQVLMDANLSKHQIDHIVLVGGSTRIPLIRQRVADFFEKTPLTDLDPDQIVAMGAALQASALVGNRRDAAMLLLDVIPLSLGIEMMGGIVEKILSRNSPIPAKATQFFTTYQDGQTGLSLHIVQGERELASDCRSLARFDLTGIPPMRAGKAKIEVTFQVDTDGLLSVQAQELTSGIKSQIDVKPTYGLTQEAVTAMIENAILHADLDIANKKLHEKINEAKQLLSSLDNALKTDASLLSLDQHQALLKAMQICHSCVKSRQFHEIAQAIKSLTPLAQVLGELRLNQSLQQALAGKTLDELENVFYD